MTEDREAYVPEQASLLAISRVLEETARMLHDWALADDPPLRRPADHPLPVTAATVRSIIAARRTAATSSASTSATRNGA